MFSNTRLRRMAASRAGGVATIFALTAPVILIAVGIAIDFSNASQIRARLNASADAGALAAVTPDAMLKTNAVAKTTASNTFYGDVTALTSLNAASVPVSISIVNPNGNVTARTATVAWSTTLTTNFGALYGQPTVAISGTATATNTAAAQPNIDFYLVLDNSPSMALPATSQGISLLSALTTNSCAFACHQVSPDWQTASNPVVNGQRIDNYQVARNNGIPLRIDQLTTATTVLLATASYFASSQTGTIPTYRFAVNSIDSSYARVFTSVVALTTDYLNSWLSTFNSFQLMEMFASGQSCVATSVKGVTNPCSSGISQTTANGLDGYDADTNLDASLSATNALMPAPGNGTNTAGDTPKEILFLITDGVEDELSGANRVMQAINANGGENYCSDIKNRGIKIAILYTTYLPLPTNPFYVQYVAPFQTQIAPALQACATPGLFYQAGVDDNIPADMATLFQLAVAQTTARLTQ